MKSEGCFIPIGAHVLQKQDITAVMIMIGGLVFPAQTFVPVPVECVVFPLCMGGLLSATCSSLRSSPRALRRLCTGGLFQVGSGFVLPRSGWLHKSYSANI